MKSLIISLLGFASICTLPATAQCPAEDSLANNSTATAFPLPPGSESFQNLVVMGVGATTAGMDPGNDWFSINLGPGRTVDIDTAYDTTQVALYLQFYTTGFGFISGTNPSTGVAALSYTNTLNVPTAILLRVTSASTPSGCGDYTLFSSIQACPGDDLLENFDDCDSSLPLASVSAIQQRRLAVLAGDDDWFDIPLQPGERLDASIFFEHARADIDLYLRDQTGGTCGSNLASGISTTNDEMVTYTNITNAPMDIAVGVVFFGTVNGEMCNDYELAYEVMGGIPDDIFENNDTVCTPAQTGIGGFPDLVVTDFDSDFYVIEIFDGERARFSIDFTHANGDIDMRLWDFSGGCGSETQIAGSFSTSDYEEVFVEHTGSTLGVYVAEVYYFPMDGGFNDYELTVGRGLSSDLGETVCDGELNSTGSTSETVAGGSNFVSANTFLLSTTGLPVNSFAFYNTSMGYGFVANPAGSSGNICITGAPTGRFVGPGQIVQSNAQGETSLAVDLNFMPQPNGLVQVVPGDTWFFQLWHRDGSPSGPTSNFSSTTRVRFE